MNYKTGHYMHTYPSNKQRSRAYTKASVSGNEADVCGSTENLTTDDKFVVCNTLRQEPQSHENRSISSSYNTLIIHGASDDQRLSSGTPPYSYLIHNNSASSNLASRESSYRTYDPGVCEITNIPDDYLSQSQVLKHLAKEVKVPYSSDCCHCENSINNKLGHQLSQDEHYLFNRAFRSKSQPDLSRLHRSRTENPARHTFGSTRKDQRCVLIMENLLQENSNLKFELEACYQKVAKSQKLEQEVGKVHRAHEDLVESCERRERLERTARAKLQAEIRRVQDTNRGLREQVDALSKQLIAARVANGGGYDAAELAKRDALIAQLVAQNKELVATKDRQEIELSAQRVTLEEQRTHIDILDTALTNAQANVVRLEEDCRKKQMHVDRVAQLQRALSSLQLASDRREQTERKLRLQLENELKMERARNNNRTPPNVHTGNESLAELKRKIRERDEKIMQLEGEVAKWEQRYLEESELRQAAIDAASIPKDAKIAALEKTSQESEKIIAEARTEKLRQMDKVHAAQKKVTDLESRTKELESKLAERDAMIKVLQKKHTFEKEATSNSYPSISLSHTPHSSINMGDLSNEDLGGPASTTSVHSSASSVLTSSTGFGSGTSYGGSITGSLHQRGNNKFDSHSFDEKSLDDQLKELDSQLLSKRGLCCFPGFSHPGAMPRKGKTSQPLLAGVAADGMPLFESGGLLQGLMSGQNGTANRPDDMLLLEKQGLCSQAQRQTEMARGGSLPPSSLPRPKKHRKSAKFGDYGRLSDGELTPTKMSAASADGDFGGRRKTPPAEKRECGIPRRFGEYRKLSEGEARYTLEVPEAPKMRDSPTRTMFLKWGGDYNKLKIADNERKLSNASEGSVKRGSPMRSLIPAPKKETFEAPKIGPNVESKLRIFSPSGVPGRRGSLQRETSGKKEEGVRSLPTPNKYRIHF